jgi:tetratricopeptide (TPR) repeat protein
MARRKALPMCSSGIRSIVIAAIALAAGRGQLHAQSGSAEALYTEGHRLLDQGKLAQACEAFEASNRALPGAGTYLALGTCRERNGQLASAWSAYQAALARAKDGEKRRFARTRIDEIKPRLSYLTVAVSADNSEEVTLTRNGSSLDPMLWNRPLPVDGGDYVIEGRVPGREQWRTTVHVPIERGAITAVVPDLEKHTRPVSKPAVPWSMRRKVSVGFAVTSVAAAGLAVGLGLRALSYEKEANALCRNPEPRGCDQGDRASALSATGHRFAIAANVTWGLAGAAAITAGVLWFTGGRGIAIAPTASAEGFAVTATRRF